MSLSEFELLAPLSANDLCSCYEARCRDGALVEVRILRNGTSESTSQVSLWKQIRLAQMVRHPAIQRVLRVDQEHHPGYVVLERRVEQSLADSTSFSADLGAIAQLATGLSAAHRLGICHGQLEPHAIFVDPQGELFVDLTGLVPRELASGERMRFVAPEVCETGIAEAASDVYGLATVLEWIIEARAASFDSPDLRSLCAECRSSDPTARPRAAHLAARLGETARARVAVGATQVSLGPEKDVHATAVATTLALPPATHLGPASLSPGFRLGRFEILQKLGEGGMGAVFRARDAGDGSTVAIKVLNPSAAATADSHRRFAKEARLLARANNPYVVNLLAFNEDDGLSYLTLEYVGGGSVGGWLHEHRCCDEQAALTLIADVARGLSVAHQRGIVHRDIKPDNILLTPEGADYLAARTEESPAPQLPLVKLSDFGLARGTQLSESLAITYDGMVIGTPTYMSPEQCRGVQADARSDIYSLGATLFHLLTGSTPFQADTPVAMMNKHCHQEPPRLQKLQPRVSEGIERVVAKCLAKNPDARYLDASELLHDLDRLRRGAPTSIVVHPVLPTMTGKHVLTFEFAWELNASPSQLWPYVSNTDRVNHAMGLPSIRYRTQLDPQRGVRRFAETRVAGQRLTWEEHPYEWIEGRRMSVLREFTRGPFHWFVNIVELRPRAGGGTTLSQTFQVAPINLLGRLLAKFEIGTKSSRLLGRVYRQIDDYMTRGERNSSLDAFRKPAELPVAPRARLDQRLDILRKQHIDPLVVETLGQYLAHASDQDVARIRPLAFAERFRLDPSQVVSACLWGARSGLLVLLWDILCPSCRIPSDVKETLAALEQHGHCDACNVDFELDFANSVEVIFRAHPDIRQVETRTYCIGGPAFSAHVVAQTRLRPAERFQMDLALADGSYRVRGPQLPFAVDLRVTPAGTVGRWELALSRPPLRRQIPQFQTGHQVLTLLNDTQQELLVRLERTASRTDALTAAEASCLALFREMFPGQVLSPGQMVSVTSVTLFLTQIYKSAEIYRERGDGAAFDVVRQVLARQNKIVAEYGGAIVKTEGDGVFSVFSDVAAAVRAATEILRSESSSSSIPLQMAIHAGAAMVTTLNDRLDYFGNTIHIARQLLAAARANEMLLTDAVTGVSEVPSILRERGFELRVDAQGSSGIVTRCRQIER